MEKRMKRLEIIWGLILVGLVLVLTIIGVYWKKNTGVYKQLENKLSKEATKYRDSATIGDNEKVRVTLEELKEANLIDEFKANNKDCSGYVEIYKDGMTFKYEPFIKCEEYTTKGYES